MPMPPYLLDSNFFIEAHRKSYPLDVFPGFWKKVAEMAELGQIGSIDKVKNEIYRHEDALKNWCEENLIKDFFQDSATAIFEYSQVVHWAYSKLNNPYHQSALDIFMQADEADAFLVAFAKKHGQTIITSEVSAPESKRNIKIPDVCQPFGVRFLPPVQLFRELGMTI